VDERDMQISKLKTEPRTKTGSAESRRIRRAGRLPAVVYGLGKEPYTCSVDTRSFQDELHGGHRTFKLGVDGEEQAALLQEIHYDAIGEHVVHLDFKRVDLNVKVRVKVGLNFVGIPEFASGGVVDHVNEDVEVECLPADIPAAIEVSIAGLTIGSHIEASAVKLPPSVKLTSDPHTTLISYHYKAVEQAPVEAATETAQPEMLKEKKDAAAAPEAKAGEKAEKGDKEAKK
jgi:large subunit ribosomal protein L25